MEQNTAVTTHKQFTNGNVHQLEPPEDNQPKLWKVLEPWPHPVGPGIFNEIESALLIHTFVSKELALTVLCGQVLQTCLMRLTTAQDWG